MLNFFGGNFDPEWGQGIGSSQTNPWSNKSTTLPSGVSLTYTVNGDDIDWTATIPSAQLASVLTIPSDTCLPRVNTTQITAETALRWMAILKRSAAIPPDGTYVTKEPLLSPCLTPPPCLTTSSATRPRASCPHCRGTFVQRVQNKNDQANLCTFCTNVPFFL